MAPPTACFSAPCGWQWRKTRCRVITWWRAALPPTVHPQFISPGIVSAVSPRSSRQVYVDEAFPVLRRQPATPRVRAHMSQTMKVLDSYVCRPLQREILVERVRAPSRGHAPDEARIAAALPRAQTSLRASADISGGGRWPSGEALTLADMYAARILAFYRPATEG